MVKKQSFRNVYYVTKVGVLYQVCRIGDKFNLFRLDKDNGASSAYRKPHRVEMGQYITIADCRDRVTGEGTPIVAVAARMGRVRQLYQSYLKGHPEAVPAVEIPHLALTDENISVVRSAVMRIGRHFSPVKALSKEGRSEAIRRLAENALPPTTAEALETYLGKHTQMRKHKGKAPTQLPLAADESVPEAVPVSEVGGGLTVKIINPDELKSLAGAFADARLRIQLNYEASQMTLGEVRRVNLPDRGAVLLLLDEPKCYTVISVGGAVYIQRSVKDGIGLTR